MNVIFLRHGKAIDSDFMLDESRYLTKDGVKALYENLPFLAEYLQKRNFEIWSSGLVRAKETAAVLAELTGTSEISEKKFIETGDSSQLVAELKKAADSTVVIVGHQPYLSIWVEQLCGVELEFRKGAAVEILLDAETFERGKILWSLRLKEMEQLHVPEEIPLEKRTFLTEYLARLSEYFSKIEENHARFLAATDEIESVHQLRVAIRSYRAILSLSRLYVGRKDYREIQNVFRIAGNELGYLREIDVLTGVALDSLKASGDDPESSLLLALFRAERESEKQRLLKLTAKKRYLRDMRTEHDLLLRDLQRGWVGGVTVNEFILPQLDEWYAWIMARIRAYTEFSFPYIHETRLKCKRYRYISEAFAEGQSAAYQERQQAVKKLQTIFGDICDVIRNQEAVLEMTEGTPAVLQKEAQDFIAYEKGLEAVYKEKLDRGVLLAE